MDFPFPVKQKLEECSEYFTLLKEMISNECNHNITWQIPNTWFQQRVKHKNMREFMYSCLVVCEWAIGRKLGGGGGLPIDKNICRINKT